MVPIEHFPVQFWLFHTGTFSLGVGCPILAFSIGISASVTAIIAALAAEITA